MYVNVVVDHNDKDDSAVVVDVGIDDIINDDDVMMSKV